MSRRVAPAFVDPLEHEVIRRVVGDGEHLGHRHRARLRAATRRPVASVVKNSGGAARMGLGEDAPAVVEVDRVRLGDVAAVERRRAHDAPTERALDRALQRRCSITRSADPGARKTKHAPTQSASAIASVMAIVRRVEILGRSQGHVVEQREVREPVRALARSSPAGR